MLKGFNPATTEPDPVRWFDGLGSCRCGKPATGKLRGPRNESYGNYCRPCAEKRLKRAEQERAEADAYNKNVHQ